MSTPLEGTKMKEQFRMKHWIWLFGWMFGLALAGVYFADIPGLFLGLAIGLLIGIFPPGTEPRDIYD